MTLELPSARHGHVSWIPSLGFRNQGAETDHMCLRCLPNHVVRFAFNLHLLVSWLLLLSPALTLSHQPSLWIPCSVFLFIYHR